MEISCVISIIVFIVVLLLCISNPKVSIYRILIDQIKVFRNANDKNKIAIFDIICFIVCPFILSYMIVFVFNCGINKESGQVLINIYSIIFTVLFGFTAILIPINKTDKTRINIVANETFISLVSSIILLFISILLLIALYFIKENLFTLIISFIVFNFSFSIMLLLMLIIKRVYILFKNNI